MSRWLITGGTGTFGHAFTRRLLDDGHTVVIYSRDELKQAQMRQEFGDDPRLRFFIGNVTDQKRLEQALRGVDYVAHAAAMKRIETCEANPAEAVQTNIMGTLALSRACIAAGVKQAVFLSTDKAAHPNTLYGATKMTAERLWVAANVYAAGTPTRFAATRYGNVLGSRGSVLGIWKHQAEHAGEITVTHEGCTRFWMTIEEAVDLVELAFREMRGGEVFVPRIQACSILTLAEYAAPGVPYVVTGLRRGEKLHETLVTEDEATDTYDCGDHYRIEPQRTWENAGEIGAVGAQVPSGFVLRSDRITPQLSVEAIADLLRDVE